MPNATQLSPALVNRGAYPIAVTWTLVFAVTMIVMQAAQAQTFTVLHNFADGLDGANPYTGLTLDRAGNLYGTATYGGFHGNDCNQTGGCGTVFELSRQGSSFVFRALYQFQGFPSSNNDGANPLGRVIIGPDGALYGTTAYGGANLQGCSGSKEPGCGTLFKLTPPPTFCKSFTCDWDETVVFNFPGPPNGFLPRGEIAFDSAGNLYGSTYYGGGIGSGGTVYELTPAQGSWTQTLLVALQSGSSPYGGVQIDQAGNVYGSIQLEGSVFEMVPSGSGWTRYTLYNFPGNGGYDLVAGVIVGPNGNLYGGTADGSPNPVIYELSPSNGGWAYTTLYTLAGSNCCGLSAKLVMDSAGNLYGTTLGGYQGSGYGSVFELSPSNGGWTYTDLHDFTNGSDGGSPYSSIVIDSVGNLYGTASTGGTNGYGTVWEITP